MIAIVDYGVGNIHSAMKGLRRFTDDVTLSEDADVLRTADALVLPGQGSFEAGMKGLNVRGLTATVREFAATGKPILGICLGAQLLLERGYEFGDWEGLGFLPGTVVHFPPLRGGAKIPHMGWNSIEEASSGKWNGTALQGITNGADMYFIHSYILQPKQHEHILAETEYGGLRFPSVIGAGNILGCQFHPEKSATEGLRIIENFVRIVR
jgi:glutamine amidotransferase